MSTKRDRIRTLAQRFPSASVSEIARVVGLTRQRVSRILQDEGLAVGQPSIDVRGREHTRQRIPLKTHRGPVRTGGVPMPRNSTVTGTIAELLVAADLMARGFAVFFPLRRTEACDLVTLAADGRVERIEVRKGSRIGRRIQWAQKPGKPNDRYAIVVTGEPVTYSPPF